MEWSNTVVPKFDSYIQFIENELFVTPTRIMSRLKGTYYIRFPWVMIAIKSYI